MVNEYMPIAISMTDRSCLVVGGGKVALRKIEMLLNYEPNITVIAPKVDDKIQYFGDSKKVKLKKREYKSPEASMYSLVISASNDEDINKTVAKDCREAGVPVNVVDNPALCDFIFPATLRRGNLTVSVSSDGKAPFFSSNVRKILEDIFPQHWKKLADLAAEFRKMAGEKYPTDSKAREACFEKFLAADWKELLKKKDRKEIKKEMEEMLQ
jgi:siroheme synthase-like protein